MWCVPSGIDKITEKSQVSEDGTMVAIPHSDSPQTADSSAVAGASDTESNSERDSEVQKETHQWRSDSVSGVLFSVFLHVLYSADRFSTQSQKQRGVGCQACHRRQQPGALIQTGWGEVFHLYLFSRGWWFLTGRKHSDLWLVRCQVLSWKTKLPLQTIMRLLQVLVPQVEKICIDK